MESTSTIVVGKDTAALLDYAHKFAAKFNPADIFWLTANEGAASIQVKETIDFIERAYLSPVGDGKLMIIFDISTMTPQAQNKMLKTIEDAPARTSFILLATDLEPVLMTIRSRCMTKYLPITKHPETLIPKNIAETLKKMFHVELDEKTLNVQQKHDILNTLAKINRNIANNCNPTNQQDLLILEILKYAKNS